MDVELSAVCGCKSVTFKTKHQPILQLCCHCTDCRAATGDDFSNIVFFKKNVVEITGNVKSVDFASYLGNTTERLACTQCGEVMFDKSSGFEHILGVVAQRMAPPFDFKPQMHVWTQSKQEHVKIPDQIRSFSKGVE